MGWFRRRTRSVPPAPPAQRHSDDAAAVRPAATASRPAVGVRAPVVFISYAHETPQHRDAVRRLYDLLRAGGVEPILDQIVEASVGDWALWCRNEIDRSDFILVIASAAYKRRSDTPEQLPEDIGRGVFWEASYIRRRVYDRRERSIDVFPVVLPGEHAAHLPNFLNADPDAVLAIPELNEAGVAGLVDLLVGRTPRPDTLGRPAPAGWVYAGAEAGRAAAERHREHFTMRARGQRSQARGGDLFQGRGEALTTITNCLQAPQPPMRVLVVTGQPGAGKSAVVARAALGLEAPAIEAGEELGLAFHARDAGLFDFLHAMAIATHTPVAESVSGLIDRVRNAAPPAGGAWRVVVDALDETATASARDEIVRALTELAKLPAFRVVVATRALAADSRNRFAADALLPALGVRDEADAALVDLDTDRYFDPAALTDLAADLLAQRDATNPGPPDGAWRAYRADPAVGRRLAEAVAGRAGRNFLVAALSADLLSQQPAVIDPAAPGFDPTTLPSGVGGALAKYLDQQSARDRAELRGRLAALAYARGAGVDDALWIEFAGALGYPTTVGDLDVLRSSRLADFLLEASTVDDIRVTRLFHQALVDELLATRPTRADEAAILSVLTPTPPSTWLQAGAYAKAFAADHATAAGRLSNLLRDPVYPTVADLARLLPLLSTELPADAAPVVAVLRAAGTRASDLPPARRAGLLSLTAAHFGRSDLTLHYGQSGNPTIGWAHSRGTPHQTLEGHSGTVWAMTVSRVGDRDIIVSGGADHTVRIWDAVTGQPAGEPLTGHAGTIYAVTAGRAGDRELIVSGGADHTVRIWDAVTGQPVGEPLTGHGATIYAVAVGRVGGRDVIVSGGADRAVRVWDAVTGQAVGKPLAGHTGGIHALVLGRVGDRDVIVSGSNDGTVRVWDAVTGRALGGPLQGHTDRIHAVALGRVGDRDVIVSGSADQTLRVWDAVSGEPIGEPLEGHTGGVWAVVLGRLDGREVIVSGSHDATARIWDAATGQPLGRPLRGHTGAVHAVALGHFDDREVIVSASHDTTVRVWDAVTRQPVGDFLEGHTGTVWSLALGRVADRQVIVSGSYDRRVRVWDAATGQPIGAPLVGHTATVHAVALGRLADRDIIVSGSFDRRLRMWDAATGEPIGPPLEGHTGRVYAVALGRLGGRDVIVSAGQDGTLRVWDAVTGQSVGDPLVGHTGTVHAVALGRWADRDVVASGGQDGTVRLWDGVTGQSVGDPLVGYAGPVHAVAVGRCGGRDVVVSGGQDGTVRLWDAVTGGGVGQPLRVHTGQVAAVALGRVGDRDVIAAASDDRSVRVWDAAARTELQTLDTLDAARAVVIDRGRIVVASGATIWTATLG